MPIPIVDQNRQTDPYMHLQVDRPYIGLNSETYISIRQQELRTLKRIGYEFYCGELFMVKHESKYSCKDVIYFNLNQVIIKENCKIVFYFNKTDIAPTLLDRGKQNYFSKLAKW